MNYYYYPLCSKDFTFENIFASESISPPAFYELRGFGFDFFYKIPGVHSEKAIVLYSAPPKFDTGTDAQHIKFVLKISGDALDSDAMVTIGEDVIGYQKTIYLTRDNMQVLFFSEKEKNLARLKSETSLPTKHLKKYEKNFEIILEETCREFNLSGIEKIDFDQESLKAEIAADRKYNNIKGFLYGLICGWLNEKSPEEITLVRSLQEITTSFAELKNRLDNIGRIPTSRVQRTNISLMITTDESLKKVKASINKAKNSFSLVHPVEEISHDILARFISNSYKDIVPSYEKAMDYLRTKILDDSFLSTDHFDKIKANYLRSQGKNNPTLLFETLQEQVDKFTSARVYPNDSGRLQKEGANDHFKKIIFQLTQIAESALAEKNSSRSINLDGIVFKSELYELVLTNAFTRLDGTLKKDFIKIVNNLLRFSKFGKGDAPKSQLLEIVENVADNSGKKIGKETQLYQYLNNEIHDYNFDSVQSVIMQNFVAFIFNPDSIEKLELFLNAKNIEEKWIACSFWCAYNGFANTSRNFTKPIFDRDDGSIHNYLELFLSQIKSSSLTADPHTVAKLNEPAREEGKNDKRKKLFHDEYIAGKFKISYDEFSSVMDKESKAEMLEELVSKHKWKKREAIKLVDKYLAFKKEGYLF
jgi:hypothetical protein